jgi:hypothetical protein
MAKVTESIRTRGMRREIITCQTPKSDKQDRGQSDFLVPQVKVERSEVKS